MKKTLWNNQDSKAGVVMMNTVTERTEKKMLSLVRGDSRTGLKIEVGPDKRARLVLEGGRIDDIKRFTRSGCLAQGEPDCLGEGGIIDFPEEDFDF
jgi:hypothetical protein